MTEMSCPKCGAALEKGQTVCPACGAKLSEKQEESPYRPAYASPIYDAPPPSSSRFAPLSSGGFLVNMIVMSIPLIGLITALVWAFGGCKNRNRRNHARGWLLFVLILAALAAAAYFLLPLLGFSIELADPSWNIPQL